MFRKTRIALALLAAPAAAMLAMGSGVASAATSPCSAPGCVVYSANLAGIATIFTGNTTFNDVRGNTQNLPDFSAMPDSKIGTVAHGVILQRWANQSSDTVGLALVNGTTSTSFTCDNGGNPRNEWILESGRANELPGHAIPPSMLSFIFNDASGTNQLICVEPHTPNYYLEIHDSTLFNTIGFDAGYIEPGDNVLTETCTFPDERFHEAGVGIDTTDSSGAAAIPTGSVFHFNREGLTVLLNPNLAASPTNGRLTFDSFNIREFIGTEFGNAPSVSNPVTLSPTIPLGAGSAFSINVP